MKLTCNALNPPLGGVLTASFLKQHFSIEIDWKNETKLYKETEVISCESSNDLCRTLARLANNVGLYGSNAIEQTQIDHWLSLCIGPLCSKTEYVETIKYLNKMLAPVTYLTAKRITIADFSVFAVLFSNNQFKIDLSKNQIPSNVLRWYNLIMSMPCVTEILYSMPEEAKNLLTVKTSARRRSISGGKASNNISSSDKNVRSQEGKFVDLPGAEIGKVVVRFPPEASGYLHIGHAKAALLNQYYQQAFQGKLIMRFDDTNPAKENLHFEKVILEDIEMLQIKPDEFTHTSNYFDIMIDFCEKMLKEGKAYVDDTEPELMKQQREQRVESSNRDNSAEHNFKLWQEMKNGTEKGQKCCVRAKIDMQSVNGCMRDPTIYRCKNEIHPKTGTKYKVYPTYDFACPIVDALEEVTHVLRTTEYHDRDDQFYWFIEALNLRKPYIWEYSRLSMMNTVLSKRKLTWFVQEHLVDGWDDPRMPTVRGVLRRGMTVEGLKQFIIAQGSSRSVVFMEWDKIWAFNKKVIDPIAPRYTAIEYEKSIPVLVDGVKLEQLSVPKHPKNPEVGNKSIWIGPRLLIDLVDAEVLKEGENATFINWGNLKIMKIHREKGKITKVDAVPNLENKDYKKTLKLTWLCETEKAPFTPCFCVDFDHIISKPLLGKDEDFKNYIGVNTRTELQMLGDPELKSLKEGDIIQLQRRGFFRVDVSYEEFSPFSCAERPIILFAIPDGRAKETSTAGVIKKVDISNNASSQLSKPKLDLDKTELKVNTKSAGEINTQIQQQGDKVRNLKTQKAEKLEIDTAVKVLLELKAQYKSATGFDWKPGCAPLENNSQSFMSKRSESEILFEITAQGDKIRKFKSEKAQKSIIDSEVSILLSLKNEYKSVTGNEWSANIKPKVAVDATKQNKILNASENDEKIILDKIKTQGDKIRNLKSNKVEKTILDNEVKILLALKESYKNLTGNDWKPEIVSDKKLAENKVKDPMPESDLLLKISSQGDKVRQLKSNKADKKDIDAEVKVLLDLKTQYKNLTGKDWKPGTQVALEMSQEVVNSPSKKNSIMPNEINVNVDAKEDIIAKINDQGTTVRNLKSQNASKIEIDAAVKRLLDLKAEYKKITGTDFPTPGRVSSKKEVKLENAVDKKKSAKENKNECPSSRDEGTGPKKQTRLGLEAKKEENLSDWYSQVITKGEMIEYYDVSGCYIYRPWSYSIWEIIKDWFDMEIKKLGVQNCYFPIFVSKSVLEKEKKHIADFAPEVAWVTKSGDSEMAEPVAVRPTSETVMYPAYAKWIQSYRDLPLKLNQWNNVVRWEFKHPQPFLRTREFLWQEGHTAFATKAEADEEVLTILDLYAKIYTDLLAIPVIKGRKTEKEKFAGGDYTTTVEAYVSASGRAIQGATSHHLGQNFSQMFDIVFEDPETQEKQNVFQNSWGITTRTIGVMIMIHADNQGLVLPPRVASIQVIIVPCGVTVSLSANEKKHINSSCSTLEKELLDFGIRTKGDYRDNYSPGWKFNHWELKGVPIRIELGPKDIKNNQLVAVRRDTGEKIVIKRESAPKELHTLLDTIQSNLLAKATKDLNEHTVISSDWSLFCNQLDNKNIIMSPFCGDISCEDKIKADSARDDSEVIEPGAPAMGAKSLCIPFEQPASVKSTDKCIHPSCTRKPVSYTLFGRSY